MYEMVGLLSTVIGFLHFKPRKMANPLSAARGNDLASRQRLTERRNVVERKVSGSDAGF
jgi:hypothetical protein